MIRRTLYIGRWTVEFLFASGYDDEEEVLDALYDAEASYEDMLEVHRNMQPGTVNYGFAYSKPGSHYAVVLIGPTSSGYQFVNTLVHELHHVAVFVADELGIDLDSETPAYIAGDSAMELAEVICDMGCSKCHED